MHCDSRNSWSALSGATLAILLAFAPCTSLALQWESIGPEGGRVDGLAQAPSNPDRMYVLPYRQGVWRSENRGTSWARVDTGLAPDAIYEAIAVSSIDDDLVIVAPQTGDSVLRSSDGGVTWSSVLIASGVGIVRDIVFDPTNGQNVLLSIENGIAQGVHRSTDAGMSWVASSNGLGTTNPNQIAYHPTAAGTVLLAAGSGVFRSTDGGVSWTQSNTNGSETVGSISISPSSPSHVWTLGYPDGFMRSTDGGLTFGAIGFPAECGPFNCFIHAVLVHPTDPSRILSGFYDVICTGSCDLSIYVRQSTDSGSTWSSAFVPNGDRYENQSISSFFFDAASANDAYFSVGQMFGNAYRLGLARTTDGGGTWNPWMNGLSGINILDVECDPTGRVYARGSMLLGLWSSNAPGTEWTDLSLNQSGEVIPTVFEVNKTLPGILYQGSVTYSMDTVDPHFNRSTDFGVTWKGGVIPQQSLWVQPSLIASDHFNGQTVYVWCEADFDSHYLCRSTNGGQWFDVVHEEFLAAGAVIDPANPNRVFAIRQDAPGDVQLTTDGGVTWTPRSTGLPSGQGVALLGDPANADRLAAVYRTAGVSITTNGGLSWSSVPLPGYSSQPIIDADWDPTSDRFFLATQSAGVYVSGAGFVTAGLSTSRLTSIDYEPSSQSVLLGTEHASVLRLDVGGAVDVATIQPPQFDMAIRATPNPSSGEFHFEINLPNDTGRALLSIFDVSGRRIASPFAGSLSRGRHVIDWSGRTSFGERASPGVYFARLEADGKVVSTRLTMVE